MKFTKDEFSEALKTRMTANGKKLSASDRTIKALAEKIYARLEKAENDEELEAVVAEYLPDFEEINGNIRKDNSDFVKSWGNGNKPNPNEPNPQEPPKAKTTDERLDEIMKEFQALKAENAAARERAEREDKLSQIRKTLTEKGVKDEKWLSSYIRKLSVTKESDVEAEVKDALELFNLSTAQTGSNANVGNGNGGTRKDETDYSDIVAALKRERG